MTSQDDQEAMRAFAEFAARPTIEAVHRKTGEEMIFTREWFDAEMAKTHKPVMFTQDEDDFFSLADAIFLVSGVHTVHDPNLAWVCFRTFFLPVENPRVHRSMEYKLKGGK